jgi:uncharacterized protein (TIGR00725 family)
MRRVIVGAIGGDREDAGRDAEAFGAAVARAGLILTTGGKPSGGPAVKNAAMRGAADSGAIARLIGFLPQKDAPAGWVYVRPYRLMIGTGLKSTMRNGFTGLTPDVMVVFPGSRGTLTELAFAWKKGSHVLLWNSRQFLKQKRAHHEVARDSLGSVYDQIEDARQVLPVEISSCFTVDALAGAMGEALDTADEWTGDSTDIVQAIRERCGGFEVNMPSGYPGMKNDVMAKERFEKIVMAISSETKPAV